MQNSGLFHFEHNKKHTSSDFLRKYMLSLFISGHHPEIHPADITSPADVHSLQNAGLGCRRNAAADGAFRIE